MGSFVFLLQQVNLLDFHSGRPAGEGLCSGMMECRQSNHFVSRICIDDILCLDTQHSFQNNSPAVAEEFIETQGSSHKYICLGIPNNLFRMELSKCFPEIPPEGSPAELKRYFVLKRNIWQNLGFLDDMLFFQISPAHRGTPGIINYLKKYKVL